MSQTHTLAAYLVSNRWADIPDDAVTKPAIAGELHGLRDRRQPASGRGPRDSLR